MVAEADDRRVVRAARRTLPARRGIGERRGARGRRALRLGRNALARRTFGVMAARVGAPFGVPVRALAVLDRSGGALGAPAGAAATCGRPLAPRRIGLFFGRQLSAVLPVDLARDQLLDLVDRLRVDARDDRQRDAELAGAAGAADAMDVILGVMRARRS